MELKTQKRIESQLDLDGNILYTLTPKERVVVILSGGMDSTTLLYDVRSMGLEVFAITFDYGQKHSREVHCARETCSRLEVPWKHVNLKALNRLAPSALTREQWVVPHGNYDDESMKQTVVPNRNMVLIALATSYALGINANAVYYGAHSGDHCVPGSEVVITPNGKMTLNELRIGDSVLSYDVENKRTSFKEVINKVCNNYRDDVLCITTKGGRSIRVTSNHKVFKVDRSNFHQHTGWQKKIVEVPASELSAGDWVISPAVGYPLIPIHTEDTMIDLLPFCDMEHDQLRYDDSHIWFKAANKVKRFVDSRSFVKLLAWFITEGSHPGDSQSNTYRMAISQSKDVNPENCEEIYELLSKWGFNYTHSSHSIYFSGPTTRVLKLCGKVSRDKHIPSMYLNMHPKDWLDTIIKGDGHSKDDHDIIVTTSDELKEQVCYLATVLGYTTGVNVLTNGAYSIRVHYSLKKQMNYLGEAKMYEVKDISVSKGEIVYDITVEGNHNFFAGSSAGLLVSNSIYPDCRPSFVNAMRQLMYVCDWSPVELRVPYLYLNKGDIACIGRQLNVDYSLTHTCYEGEEKPCGMCGACRERAEAFEQAGMIDPLVRTS